jgi:oligoendopeptidase F
MAVLMNKHMHSYMGDAVELNEEDGYLFVYWSHIRRFFYVYSYAYGLLISRTLYEKWKSDKSYKAKIEQFLSAGGSMSPKDIFKSIGINTNEAFFEAGLKGIEADIIKLEKLAKKYKKI